MTRDDLTKWRQKAGMTQEALAKMIGKRRPTVTAWETGRYEVPRWLEILLRAIDREVEWEAMVKGVEAWVREEIRTQSRGIDRREWRDGAEATLREVLARLKEIRPQAAVTKGVEHGDDAV